MATYTLGEVMRKGLLKNHKGEPYKHKATIQRLLHKAKRKDTVWGKGYAITQADIDKLNARWN
jgi:hypothetical protein